MARKKRTAPAPDVSLVPPVGDLLAEDLRQADELAAAITGKAAPEHRPYLALWLAVERLRRTIQAAAPAPWEISKEATYDKARALGVAPEAGECWQALAQRLKQVSGWPAA